MEEGKEGTGCLGGCPFGEARLTRFPYNIHLAYLDYTAGLGVLNNEIEGLLGAHAQV